MVLHERQAEQGVALNAFVKGVKRPSAEFSDCLEFDLQCLLKANVPIKQCSLDRRCDGPVVSLTAIKLTEGGHRVELEDGLMKIIPIEDLLLAKAIAIPRRIRTAGRCHFLSPISLDHLQGN
jgi:hypothetical protein